MTLQELVTQAARLENYPEHDHRTGATCEACACWAYLGVVAASLGVPGVSTVRSRAASRAEMMGATLLLIRRALRVRIDDRVLRAKVEDALVHAERVAVDAQLRRLGS